MVSVWCGWCGWLVCGVDGWCVVWMAGVGKSTPMIFPLFALSCVAVAIRLGYSKPTW